MKINLFLIMMSLVLTACASMEDNETELHRQVYDKVSEEYAICSAYYSVVSAELKSSGKRESSETDDAMENAFNVALESARQAGSEEDANRMTWARYQSSLEAMEKKSGKDYSNISVVHSEYRERCNWIMTSPGELLKEKKAER